MADLAQLVDPGCFSRSVLRMRASVASGVGWAKGQARAHQDHVLYLWKGPGAFTHIEGGE